MSTTRGTVRKEVRDVIGDTNPSHYAVSNERLNRIIQNRQRAIAALVGLPETEVLTQANVQAGDNDYEFYIATVAGAPSAEYQHVLEVRTVDANSVVSAPVPRAPIEHLRHLQANHTTTVTGAQLLGWAAFERAASSGSALSRTYISTYPARGTLGLRIRVANIPARLTADSDAIALNDMLIETLVYDCAVHAVMQMRQSEAVRALADSGAIAGWKQAVERGIIDERIRRSRLVRTPGIALVRR